MSEVIGRWLRDLVRDVLWAKAAVPIEGGYKTRPAWRYIRYVKRQVPIPDELARIARGHYALTYQQRADKPDRRWYDDIS